MRTGIIIVNYNNEDETSEFVNKIVKFNSIDKIIVVDNMSTTIGAFNKLKELEALNSTFDYEKIEVVSSGKNGGYSYGNNYGLKILNEDEKNNNIKYDYIIISNSDIDVKEKAIIHMASFLRENDEVAAIAPRMFYKDDVPARRSSWKLRTAKRDIVHSTRLLELLFYPVLRNGEYSEEDYKNNKLEVEAISGSFFMIKKDIFEQIGMFDENVFLFYEEDILGKKLKDIDKKIISLNDEKFIHYESQTIGKVFNYFKKMRILYDSKMYYQINYNNINGITKFLFKVLYLFRKIELLIEVPIRKLLKK